QPARAPRRDQPGGDHHPARGAGRAGRPRACSPRLRARDWPHRAVGGSSRAARGSPHPPGVPGAVTTRPGAIAALHVATVAVYADMYVTQPILPLLSKEFGILPASAGLTVSVVVLMIALVSSAYGSLSDRIGRKPVMVVSCALLAVPTFLCATASS